MGVVKTRRIEASTNTDVDKLLKLVLRSTLLQVI